MLRKAAAHLLIWALFAAAGLAGVDRWYGSVPANEIDLRVADMEAAAAQTEVLVLGDSRMEFGVNPRFVAPHTFNAAGASQDVHYDAQYVKRFLPEMPKLRTVVWGLTTRTFGYDVASMGGEARLCRLYDRYFERRTEDRVATAVNQQWSLLRGRGADPIHAFVSILEARYDSPFRQQSPYGDGFVYHPNIPEDITDGPKRVALHESTFDPRVVEPNFAILVETTRKLHERGIRVIFVKPPVAPTYHPSPGTNALFERYQAKLIQETHADYVDMSDRVATGQEFFRNSDHLQGEGIEQFSRMLGEIVNGAGALPAP